MSALTKRVYLMKVHTSWSYKEISLSAKPYSTAVYTKLQAWSEQDAHIAELLYGDALSGETSVVSAVPFPFTLQYEQDSTDIKASMSVIASIMSDVISAEALAVAVFNASGHNAFAAISNERLSEAQRISQYAGNGGIFAASRLCRWQCSKCGYVAVDMTAPDACPCCEAKRAAFVRAFELGE